MHDNRTATTWNCVGITALGESPITTRFLNANRRKTPENTLFFSSWKTRCFQAFSTHFCPRKWKETLCLRWKTSFKTIFRYWKTPVSNEYKPFSHLTPHSQHQENNSFGRANCQGKPLDNRTNTSICRLENNGKNLDSLVGKCQKNTWIMPRFQIFRNCFPNRWTPYVSQWSEYKVMK